jgi:DisA bacterial checkpoint controller nucleotide-binding
MRLYNLNDQFLTLLHERIQLSIKDATIDWKSDIRANTFIYNVVTMALSPILSKEILAELVETCLFASLEREEGELRPFSITIEPPNPDEFRSHYRLEREIPFNPTNLIKFVTSLDSNDYHVGVWPEDGALKVWGFKPKLLWFLTISSVSPGTISLSCLSSTKAAFKCLITLPRVEFLNPLATESNPIFPWLRDNGVLTRFNKIADLGVVLSRMQQGGHGGGLLLVREGETKWRQSIEQPLLYEPAGYIGGYSYPELVSKYEVIDEWESSARRGEADRAKLADLKNRLRLALAQGKRSLEDIYKLTRVDNAVILSENLRVMAFGARIVAQKELETIAISEPFDGSATQVVEFANWNVGNRHKSAAKFVNEQPDCLALVVSEDRRISVLSWDDQLNTVRLLRSFEAVVLG